MKLTRRRLGAVAAGLMLALGMPAARAAEPIKIGILHSLSGTMAISETVLKDLMLMMVAEQNAKGGLLGRPIEAVVVDPASNWPPVRREGPRSAGRGKRWRRFLAAGPLCPGNRSCRCSRN